MDELKKLRSEMESLDTQLITLLSRRQDLAFFIGIEKQRLKLDVEQLDYWNDCQEKRMFVARKLELSDAFVKEIFEVIHEHSKRTQGYKR